VDWMIGIGMLPDPTEPPLQLRLHSCGIRARLRNRP
jgi:hypothetical protein